MFLPIPAENQPVLIAHLEGDPFVGHALTCSSATCEVYHRYGMYLAPLTTASNTIKHCQFGHRCPAVINDGNQADGGELAGSSGGTAHRNSFASGAGTCWKGNEEESERSKTGGGRACRRSRQAKATARTASGSQGIITSTCQRSCLLLQRKRSVQTNGQNLTGSHDHRGLSGGGFTCVCLCGRKHALAHQPCVDGGKPRGQSPG